LCGLLADGYGRRVCIFVGCLLVLVGTAVQATANGLGHFIGGRFILGFGASIASAAGPAYTVELAHPAYRGFMAGMYSESRLPSISPCCSNDADLSKQFLV
jgi:MFS family permease